MAGAERRVVMVAAVRDHWLVEEAGATCTVITLEVALPPQSDVLQIVVERL